MSTSAQACGQWVSVTVKHAAPRSDVPNLSAFPSNIPHPPGNDDPSWTSLFRIQPPFKSASRRRSKTIYIFFFLPKEACEFVMSPPFLLEPV